MTSCTSPRDSAIGLPISRVRSCDERLLVVLDQPAELLDRAAADRGGDGGPRRLRGARGATGVDERLGVAQQGLGHGPERSEGFGTVRRPPGASLRDAPPTIEATVRVMAPMLPRLD